MSDRSDLLLIAIIAVPVITALCTWLQVRRNRADGGLDYWRRR